MGYVPHFDHPAMSDETYRLSLRREMNEAEHRDIDTAPRDARGDASRAADVVELTYPRPRVERRGPLPTALA